MNTSTSAVVSLPEGPKPRRKVAWLVKLLVAFHLICITIWTLPSPANAVLQGDRQPTWREMLIYGNAKYGKSQTPVMNYLLFSGAWQFWDMFAPEPMNYDVYCTAVVTYRDGTNRDYEYPRIANEGYVQKYIDERYRKFYERANSDQYALLWPPFAQRIAYLNANDPKNPPVQVQLTRHFMLVAPPGQPQAKSHTPTIYFTYSIDQKKLARDKGWTRP